MREDCHNLYSLQVKKDGAAHEGYDKCLQSFCFKSSVPAMTQDWWPCKAICPVVALQHL
jgi:hypothetical protein